MKNILFFFSTTKIGGAEANILKISRELQRRGYRIFWAYLEDTGPMLQLVDFEVKTLETGLYYKGYHAFKKKYVQFVKENSIECVLNFGLRVEVISRLLSRNAGIKKVVSNIRSTDDWRKFHHVLLDKVTRSFVDEWVSNSIAGKIVSHRRENIPLDKIKVIYNFIEPAGQIITPVNPYATDHSRKIIIGILANITIMKGYMDLITLSKELTSRNIDHAIRYAGLDLLNGQFEQQIEENKLESNFNRLGYLSDKSILFNDIDIFILPTYLEGLPTVLLEAMSYGIPVIATDVGGIPELVENDINGYICKPGDIDGYVNSITKLTKTENRNRIIQNARKSLQKFDKDVIIDQWEKILT